MKTITTSYNLDTNGKILAVSLLALFRAVGLEGEVTPAEIPASVLDTLRVRLASPGVTGAQELSTDATKACHYSIEGSTLTVTLGGLSGGVHRLWITTQYGTNTRSLLLVDLNAPENLQFLENNGAVVMPLIRNAAKDAELDGVQFYGYSYPYTGETCWLTTAKPLHLRGTVTAYYADDDETALADATALTSARIVLNPGTLVYDGAGAEAIQLGAVESFGSTGGGIGETCAVTVLLSLPEGADPIDWTSYHLTVERTTAGEVDAVDINADGEATFEVGAGEHFVVELPTIPNYTAPLKREYVAVSAEKEIAYEYTTTPHTELIVVYAHSTVSALADLIGQDVILTTAGGVTERRTFGSDLRVEFSVEYGEVVTIEYPSAEGLTPHVRTVTFTANRVERDLVAYYDDSRIGAFGRDIAGNWYTLNDESELVDEEGNVIADPSVVEFVALNTSALDMSKRDVTGDSTGNGFMVQCGTSLIGGQSWATSAVEFDTSLLPFGTDYRGAKNTEYIRAYGDEHSIGTPAADVAYNRVITFAGEERHGFLPAILQLQAYNQNYAALNAIATAAGHTLPSIASANVWSSSQGSAANAYCLSNGTVNINTKTSSLNVLVAFDL